MVNEQIPTADEAFETRARAWARDKYGVDEDDPVKYKEKVTRWRRGTEEDLPAYQSTFQRLLTAAEEAERAQQLQAETSRRISPQQETSREDALRELAKIDPYEAAKRLAADERANFDKRLEELDQRAARRADEAVTVKERKDRAARIVSEQWPEAFDRNSDLHKAGYFIFNREMSEEEKRDPDAFLKATERAAGRLGLAPKRIRNTQPDAREDAEAQSVAQRGSRNNNADREEPVKLTPRQKAIADNMGVDPKAYARAIQARRENKNIRVEDK